MQYPATLTHYGDGFSVVFRDIPEALTRGEDEADALRNAADALESALDFYFETKRPVPLPSRPKRGQHVVELLPDVAAKVLRWNKTLAEGA